MKHGAHYDLASAIHVPEAVVGDRVLERIADSAPRAHLSFGAGNERKFSFADAPISKKNSKLSELARSSAFAPLLLFMWCVSLIICVDSSYAQGIDGLIKELRSKDEQTQMAALESLIMIKEDGAVEALLVFASIELENWRVKIKAIDALGDIPDLKVSDRLVTIFNNPFLNEECPSMKWHTALALGKEFNKGSRAVDSLIEALDYNNLLVRESIIKALGRIGDPKAVPFLAPALSDKSFAIKFSAIQALEKIKDPRAIQYLKNSVANDSDEQIKEAAVAAIKRLEED